MLVEYRICDRIGYPNIGGMGKLVHHIKSNGASPLKQISMNRSAAIAAGTLLMWQDAFAYIDPGTGSLIIQWLFGMVMAGFAVLNIYWHRIKTFFARRSGHTSPYHDVDVATDEAESDS